LLGIEKDIARTDRLFDFGAISTYRPDDWKIPGFEIPDESMSVGSRQEYRRCLCLRDILLTYSIYNPDLGYVQGMSDLISPLLYVLKDEVDTFWCFASWMRSMVRNKGEVRRFLNHFIFKRKCIELFKYYD
jgi:hypothetical protein